LDEDLEDRQTDGFLEVYENRLVSEKFAEHRGFQLSRCGQMFRVEVRDERQQGPHATMLVYLAGH
jgi:hypothetical protein